MHKVLHFEEADETPRWRRALKPVLKKKQKREKKRKKEVVGSSVLPSAVGATCGQSGACDHVVKVSGVAGWPPPLCCAGGSAQHNKNWANSGEKERLEAGSPSGAVPACWLVGIFQKTITMTEGR